ncbi:hypothetical protein AAVH_41613 [Aphelenchoides avenae]|nr:hypothetical protein AAVH_41613 [Aphelenchus avenae]
MVSFLVFSISPALQLLPFVFNDVQGAWSEWKYYAFLECIDEAGDVSLLPEEEQIAARQKCDGNFPDFYVPETLILVIVIMNVWKPYIEAFTMLFLLPNYRRALFAKVRQILGMPSEVPSTLARPVSSHWATKTADP